MPTIPSPRDGHYGSRSSLSTTPRTPGKNWSTRQLQDHPSHPLSAHRHSPHSLYSFIHVTTFFLSSSWSSIDLHSFLHQFIIIIKCYHRQSSSVIIIQFAVICRSLHTTTDHHRDRSRGLRLPTQGGFMSFYFLLFFSLAFWFVFPHEAEEINLISPFSLAPPTQIHITHTPQQYTRKHTHSEPSWSVNVFCK